MTQEQKDWIDNASLIDLLRKYRFEPLGSDWFMADTGDYFIKVMHEKREADEAAWVQASKELGWEQ